MKLWSKRICITMVALSMMAAPFLSGCKSKSEDAPKEKKLAQFRPLDTSSKKPVAKYNGGQVTEGERNLYTNIYAFLTPGLGVVFNDPAQLEQYRDEIAERVAVDEYIAAKMKKNEARYSKEADETLKNLEKELNQMEANSTGNGAPQKVTHKKLDELLKGKGFTKDQLHRFFVRHHAQVAYCQSKFSGMTYDKVKVNHILIAFGEDMQGVPSPSGKEAPKKKRTEAEAKKIASDVKKKLVAGESFQKLAKQYSDDTASKDQSGLVEGPAITFVPEFAQASLKLPLNQISNPIKTSYGYHVLKVIARSKESMKNAPEQVQFNKQKEVIQQVIDKELKFKSLLPPPKPPKATKPAKPVTE